MFDYFPSLLFGGAGAMLCALALAEWSARRRLAILSLAAGGFSLLCFVANYLWARDAIRVDLLLTIPAVSLSALVVGTLAVPRRSAPSRTLGAMLAISGAVTLGWYLHAMRTSNAEGARALARFDEGNRLYWNETIRCAGNFEKRFGTLGPSGDPCTGNLVVTSRSPNSYPFTRVVLNEKGDAYLLYSRDDTTEYPAKLDEGVFARMVRSGGGNWSGQGDSGLGTTQIELTPQGVNSCQARIEHHGAASTLELTRTELPACEAIMNPPVTILGPWGEVATDLTRGTTTAGTRRLLQIWLWSENSDQGRGVLVNETATSGLRQDFLFLRPLRARRNGANTWTLNLEEQGTPPRSLTLTIDGDRATISGPADLVGPRGQAILERRGFVADPRIELVPVRDAALFKRYVDSALFNLRLSWTAP